MSTKKKKAGTFKNHPPVKKKRAAKQDSSDKYLLVDYGEGESHIVDTYKSVMEFFTKTYEADPDTRIDDFALFKVSGAKQVSVAVDLSPKITITE